MVQQDRFDQAYRDFILDLHRRIAEAGGTPRLEAGMSALLYWPGLVILFFVGAGITALLVRSLHRETLGAALFLVAVFALLLWQIGAFFRRNRPQRYQKDRVPEAVLPRAET
jgi:Flp pilus assembly protein TadB